MIEDYAIHYRRRAEVECEQTRHPIGSDAAQAHFGFASAYLERSKVADPTRQSVHA